MTAPALNQQLTTIGRQLNRWQAELRIALWSAIALAALWLLGMSDVWLQFGTAARLIAWFIFVALVAVGVWQIVAALTARRSPEAVAARIERAFPQLDNHLINFIQFARHANGDRLTHSYLQQDIPGWTTLDLSQMRDRRLHRRLNLALAGAVLLLIVPALWSNRAWGNSLLRILNPFSQRAASTLARFLEVTPGNSTLTAGRPLTLACKTEGKPGHEIWLELQPADDKPSSIKIGTLAGAGAESFAYEFPKIAGNLKYRFRAGDARSERYEISVVPPLALASLTATVQPPEYTGLPAESFDALAVPVAAPQGSQVIVTLQCNRPLTSAFIGGQAATAQDGKWTATTTIGSAKTLLISAVATDGEKLDSELKLLLTPDKPPALHVIAPQGRTALPAGADARIQWEASDDFGLTRVVLEHANGDPVQEWKPDQPREFAMQWTGSVGSYRIIAYDQTQQTRSPLLVFEPVKAKDIAAALAKDAAQAGATLARLAAMQKENLEKTTQLDATLDASTPAQWQSVTGVQSNIRQLTGQLLADPRKPLGALAAVISDVHQDAMNEVIDTLDRVPKTTDDKRRELSVRGLALEAQILRVLTSANGAFARVEQHRQISGILALLDALVIGQEEVLKGTKDGTNLPALAKKQDRLAGDVSDFVHSARGEAQRLERGDAEFAKLIRQVADGCESRQVAADMLRAAEKLEGKDAVAAVPFEEKALATLKEFQAALNQWRVTEAKAKMEDVRKVVAESKKKFEKLLNLQAKMVESMRQAVQGKDLSQEQQKEFEEELAQLKANVRDAALKIADDLHIFPELPVGNELVEDISTIFEESKQVPGSENAAADELGLQKEDFILEMMEKIKERFDDMEMWLAAKPDNMKRLTENFDQAEMPPMAVIDMPKELQDIIGELLEQQDEIRDKSDDSATNQAVPDMPMGWDIAEGEWSTFSAKGKSGNERPEHKDQDGRSLVGRQGMSNGETTAGSGKINEGDEKIENRRTQDAAQSGQVKEEDHADAKATGGGKLSGFDDEFGMPGQGPRRDANTAGSPLGMQAMLRRNAEALYARASMLHIRTGSLDEVVRALKDAEDALSEGRPIQQVREFQRRATVAMQKAQADLEAGFSDTSLPNAPKVPASDNQLAGVSDEAPAQYRDLVAEYFKSLSTAP